MTLNNNFFVLQTPNNSKSTICQQVVYQDVGKISKKRPKRKSECCENTNLLSLPNELVSQLMVWDTSIICMSELNVHLRSILYTTVQSNKFSLY